MLELIGVVIELLAFMLQLTGQAIIAIAFPIRFLLSEKYREKKRRQWNDSKARRIVDVTGAALATALFVAVAVFWMWVAGSVAAQPPVAEMPLHARKDRPAVEVPAVEVTVKMEDGDVKALDIEVNHRSMKKAFKNVLNNLPKRDRNKQDDEGP